MTLVVNSSPEITCSLAFDEGNYNEIGNENVVIENDGLRREKEFEREEERSQEMRRVMMISKKTLVKGFESFLNDHPFEKDMLVVLEHEEINNCEENEEEEEEEG